MVNSIAHDFGFRKYMIGIVRNKRQLAVTDGIHFIPSFSVNGPQSLRLRHNCEKLIQWWCTRKRITVDIYDSNILSPTTTGEPAQPPVSEFM